MAIVKLKCRSNIPKMFKNGRHLLNQIIDNCQIKILMQWLTNLQAFLRNQ